MSIIACADCRLVRERVAALTKADQKRMRTIESITRVFVDNSLEAPRVCSSDLPSSRLAVCYELELLQSTSALKKSMYTLEQSSFLSARVLGASRGYDKYHCSASVDRRCGVHEQRRPFCLSKWPSLFQDVLGVAFNRQSSLAAGGMADASSCCGCCSSGVLAGLGPAQQKVERRRSTSQRARVSTSEEEECRLQTSHGDSRPSVHLSESRDLECVLRH